jgi:hypothetical protein
MVMLGFCTISIMAAQSNFSGTWALDKGKTHGLPKNLKSYTMVVTQNEQQLVVETNVEGEVQGKANDSLLGGGGHVQAGGYSGGYQAGTLALSVINPNLAYSLDGKETTAEGISNVASKLKVKWSKDGKTLDLSIVLKDNTQQSAAATIKERWTLSEGGEVLKVQRSVATADGSDGITLFFGKGTSGAPTPQQ